MRQPTIHQLREKKKSSRKSQGSRKVTVYYFISGKNEILYGVAESLSAERSVANNSAKPYKIIFTPNKIYYFILKRNKTIKQTPLERNFSDLNY
jgi:uncharacterized membrane protein